MNKGFFKISESLSKDPQVMAAFFAKFRPIKFDLQLVPYPVYVIVCEHPDFDEWKEGEMMPQYDAECTKDENGVISITSFNRV